MRRLVWLVIRCLTKSFLKEYVYCAMAGMQCFNCTHPTYDVYDYTSGDEITNAKTAVAPA